MRREQWGRWIAEEPASSQASAAARCILHTERARGGDLNRLRATLLQLSNRLRENYPTLRWTTRNLAIQCLIYQDQYEEAIAEYRRLQRVAPNEIERLFVEMDILLAEETVELMNTDDASSIHQSILETEEQIERLLVEKEEKLAQTLLPSEFELTAIYPNPFNELVQIQYAIPEAAEIRLAVYDVTGRDVAILFNERQIAGAHHTFWNSKGIATGSYILRLESSGKLCTQKLVLIK
ncbi:MAG: T9SS type A sorting domain-containing protein [Candidatus Hatepunaea meridiana]|nr:T9SS type A sorting domain-containing protein [Candidatus Hatepunaea meridiana]